MEHCCRPIGVFDSGMGGLSVWREIVKLMPAESVIYYGDGKNCPYGDRSQTDVIKFVQEAVDLFIERDCKAIVLACNAATAMSVDYLRHKYPDRIFVGMEPAVKPAALNSQSGVIGILATKATLEGSLFKETSMKFAHNAKILSCVGDGFVELVEQGNENSQMAFDIISKCVEPMLQQGADHIVLGCTHYPFLAETISRVIGDRNVKIVDPAPAVALRTKSLLEQKGWLANKDNKCEYLFCSAADESYKAKLKQKALLLIDKYL